jgi:hypothetical protein
VRPITSTVHTIFHAYKRIRFIIAVNLSILLTVSVFVQTLLQLYSNKLDTKFHLPAFKCFTEKRKFTARYELTHKSTAKRAQRSPTRPHHCGLFPAPQLLWLSKATFFFLPFSFSLEITVVAFKHMRSRTINYLAFLTPFASLTITGEWNARLSSVDKSIIKIMC